MQRGRTVSGSLSSQLCFNSSKQSFLSLHATPVKLSTSIQAVFICDQYFCFMYVGQHIQEFSPFPSQPHKLRIAAVPWERNRVCYVRNASNAREFPGKIFMVVQIPLAEQYTRSVTFLSVIPIPPQIDLAPCLDSIGGPSGSTTANARRHSVQKIMHNIRSCQVVFVRAHSGYSLFAVSFIHLKPIQDASLRLSHPESQRLLEQFTFPTSLKIRDITRRSSAQPIYHPDTTHLLGAIPWCPSSFHFDGGLEPHKFCSRLKPVVSPAVISIYLLFCFTSPLSTCPDCYRKGMITARALFGAGCNMRTLLADWIPNSVADADKERLPGPVTVPTSAPNFDSVVSVLVAMLHISRCPGTCSTPHFRIQNVIFRCGLPLQH
ncbi:hypothetical protein B0H13DRAFT_1911923 [Mycena leptocephala]|nr:hypothetical protein B0H13DRAFT_1911923 [Mycena leptocephala]